ncbi:alpha/beta fold hydrolase [Rhodoferax sp.]|uniref:alpha/beta fold hydrolase n=1 Tax=Rhodoferax sp. TaxID=50421 RepID=UPI00374D9195
MKIRANSLGIEVEDSGADGTQAQRPVVLLVMGLGTQLTAWPPAFVQALVDAGYRVVRFDNRDIGLSDKLDHLGQPNLVWAMVKLKLGLVVTPPYSLQDMALDAIGVLDALGIRQAHVLGISMGGMIAQRVALAAPERVLSLTSIMSSSGARGLPQAGNDILRLMMDKPADSAKEAIVAHTVQLLQAIGSPGFPTAEVDLRAQVLKAFERNYHPAGSLRQTMAIGCDTARADLLPRIKAPTLVVHGRADRLVPFACGEDTARRIPGARFEAVDGMGHDLPPGVVQRLLTFLLPHLKAATV